MWVYQSNGNSSILFHWGVTNSVTNVTTVYSSLNNTTDFAGAITVIIQPLEWYMFTYTVATGGAPGIGNVLFII